MVATAADGCPSPSVTSTMKELACSPVAAGVNDTSKVIRASFTSNVGATMSGMGGLYWTRSAVSDSPSALGGDRRPSAGNRRPTVTRRVPTEVAAHRPGSFRPSQGWDCHVPDAMHAPSRMSCEPHPHPHPTMARTAIPHYTHRCWQRLWHTWTHHRQHATSGGRQPTIRSLGHRHPPSCMNRCR